VQEKPLTPQTSPMGAIFANAPIERTVVEGQVLSIGFDASCRYCRHRATTNIRPVDAIGSPMVADLYVCDGYSEQIVARARAKGIQISMWPPRD
jgi:hypothetical protein